MAPSQRRPGFLSPFQIRAFRFQFLADLCTSWGTEMEVIVLGWYILVETDSVGLLTLYGALQYLGTLIAPGMGMASDRLGHRNVLTTMRAVYALMALGLMTLAFAGALHPLYVFLLAAMSGLIRASDTGVRNALSAEILPPDRLMAGVGLSRITSDSARVAGALAGAAVYAAIGMGPACMVFAVFYSAGCLLTFRISLPAARTVNVTRPSPWGELREGVVHVWQTPALLAGMWLAFLVNLTAWPWTLGLLPYVARNVLHVGQAGLGTLAASFAAGSLLGSLIVSLLGRRILPARFMLIFALAWHAMLLVFAHMPTMLGASAMLVATGVAQSMSMVPMAVMLLHIAGPRFRGRVMGVRMLAIYGLPVGLLLSGVFISRLGFSETAILYCAIGLLVTLGIGWHWRAYLWPRDLPANTS
ncbi:MAG: MFS transporter [Acetobacteraceae bacterium]|nr:MFS transporter [Acetobacteraceae bacterium]MSP29542.1 MFS transporter [Acetobacteraceae bacterium]